MMREKPNSGGKKKGDNPFAEGDDFLRDINSALNDESN